MVQTVKEQLSGLMACGDRGEVLDGVFQHVVGVVFEGAVTAGPTTVVFFDDAKEPPRGSHDRQPRQLVTATHTTRPPGVNTAVNIRACRSQRETLWSHPLSRGAASSAHCANLGCGVVTAAEPSRDASGVDLDQLQ